MRVRVGNSEVQPHVFQKRRIWQRHAFCQEVICDLKYKAVSPWYQLSIFKQGCVGTPVLIGYALQQRCGRVLSIQSKTHTSSRTAVCSVKDVCGQFAHNGSPESDLVKIIGIARYESVDTAYMDFARF